MFVVWGVGSSVKDSSFMLQVLGIKDLGLEFMIRIEGSDFRV